MSAASPRTRLAILAAGHGCVDLCQGAVAALIPFLIARRGLDFAATSVLLLSMTVFSSVLQPLFGLVSDRHHSRAILPVALLLAASGIAVCGLAQTYPLMLGATGVAGLGVGAFHPDAARRARQIGAERGATALSLFSVGGNAGFALAPVLVTPAVLLLGPGGAAIVLLPALACAALCWRAGGAPSGVAGGGAAIAGANRWRPFAAVGTIAGLRSGVYFGLQAFLAGYFVHALHTSAATANAALTAMLVAGALGTLAGGRIADRLDHRLVLAAYMLAVGPCLALLLIVHAPAAAIALAAVVGFVTIGNFSLTVVLGQEYLPGRPGLASGVTLGLAIGAGGLIAAALGPLADAAGPGAALWALVALPLPAAAIAASLPRARSLVA